MKEITYSAVGLDEIHYKFLQKLPKDSLKFLLKIFKKNQKKISLIYGEKPQ